MERKYLIATHGYFANGLQSSLDILADKGKEVTVINAYVDDQDYLPQIERFFDTVAENQQAFIFTDLFGGSVNQNIARLLAERQQANITLISNVNLAIILSIMFSSQDYLDKDCIQAMIDESAVNMVNLAANNQEEDFF